jgi:hypothetical protein
LLNNGISKAVGALVNAGFQRGDVGSDRLRTDEGFKVAAASF